MSSHLAQSSLLYQHIKVAQARELNLTAISEFHYIIYIK